MCASVECVRNSKPQPQGGSTAALTYLITWQIRHRMVQYLQYHPPQLENMQNQLSVWFRRSQECRLNSRFLQQTSFHPFTYKFTSIHSQLLSKNNNLQLVLPSSCPPTMQHFPVGPTTPTTTIYICNLNISVVSGSIDAIFFLNFVEFWMNLT